MSFDSLDDRGRWKLCRIEARYKDYCRQFGVEHRAIVLDAYAAQRAWAAAALEPLIQRMKRGDLAAAEIGIELMEEDRGLVFGPSIKSDIPRAIAKCALTWPQKERIRRRTVEMLMREFLPKEFRQYAWLTRRIGLGQWRGRLEEEPPRGRPWFDWYLRFLLEEHPPPQPSYLCS